LSRSKLEGLVDDLIERTLEPCKIAMDDSKSTPKDIDQVILVGGMTRMPRIQERVKSFFQKTPHTGVNPDEVVALGAAIQAGVLKGDIEEVLLLDVTPLSLGVETLGGVFTRVIDKNTPIPCRESQIFSTAEDNQPIVNIHVLQGEREMSRDNKSLARFQLVEIPPAPRGVPQIEVTFAIDANGILSVSAKDLGTQQEQSVRVIPSSGLSEMEIERLVSDAESHRDQDVIRRDIAELKNTATSLMYTTERSLASYGDVLPEEEQESIRHDVELCKAALQGEDPEILREALHQLEASSYKIAEAMYADSGGGAGDS
jgi:molecular chaperone DnaK